MRTFIAGGFGAALLVAACAIPALAAAPDHQTIRGTAVDTDFCGTGQTVDESIQGAFNGWEDQATGHFQTTWTNPANGIAVYDSVSGTAVIRFIDDGDGVYTLVSIRQGEPFRLQVVNGPLIVQDTGQVISYDHFDADGNYLGTDLVIDGPHPGLELDACAMLVDLLQL
jgi:hypothetical protein